VIEYVWPLFSRKPEEIAAKDFGVAKQRTQQSPQARGQAGFNVRPSFAMTAGVARACAGCRSAASVMVGLICGSQLRLAAKRLAAKRLAAKRLAAKRLAAKRLAAKRLAAKWLAAKWLAAKWLAAKWLAARTNGKRV
jgi:hypothetical protein